MKILLIEDESHKKDELLQCIKDACGEVPEVIDGVRLAVIAVLKNDYDLIILDMALPTFGGNSDNNKGHDQAEGGVEVLRALKSKGKSVTVIIVTQYSDFYIGASKIKLKDAPRVIREKYGQIVIGAILYQYRSKSVLQKIQKIIRAVV
jgi:CheY-like chemotaxis protein